MTPIDLSKIPAPNVVEPLDYETILAALLADLQARDPSFSALVESDPAYKILEVCAFRELLLRQRINDAARGVMLAYAQGADLEQLAALYGVARHVIAPGDPNAFPPVPPTMESDSDLRRRILLALDGFSVAGPSRAYIFHALGVPDVADVSVVSPAPSVVVVSILSRANDGVPSPETIAAVQTALNDEDVRPLAIEVTVQAAELVDYTIEATIYTFSGPDPETVIESSQNAAQAYADEQKRIGLDVTLSGVYAALHQPGVQRVELTSPVASISISNTQAARCTAINLTNGGIA